MTEQKIICPSKFPCIFKRFSMDGAECTLQESLPDYVSAVCEKPWNINILKYIEIKPNKWMEPIKK